VSGVKDSSGIATSAPGLWAAAGVELEDDPEHAVVARRKVSPRAAVRRMPTFRGSSPSGSVGR